LETFLQKKLSKAQVVANRGNEEEWEYYLVVEENIRFPFLTILIMDVPGTQGVSIRI